MSSLTKNVHNVIHCDVCMQVKKISWWPWSHTATRGWDQGERKKPWKIFILMRFVKPGNINPFVKLLKSLHLFYVIIEYWLGSLTNLCYIFILQQAVCDCFSHCVPAALQPGCLLPFPTFHWCQLRGSEVCLRVLWPEQTHCVSQCHCKLSLNTHDTNDVFKSVTVYLLQKKV